MTETRGSLLCLLFSSEIWGLAYVVFWETLDRNRDTQKAETFSVKERIKMSQWERS